jgi:membrane-associated phospholipid phosphatase
VTVDSPRSPNPRSRRLWLLACTGLCGLLTIPCLQRWDDRISTALRQRQLPGDVAKAIELSEFFAHGFGVSLILASLWWLHRERRRELARAMILTVAAGALANGLKLVFTRIRPHADTNADSFDNWFPLFHGSFWDSTHRSFPSGHAATVVALAIGLSTIYPRGKWIFASCAGLACLQRIQSGAHYPSDVLTGIAIAFASASLLWPWLHATTRQTSANPDHASGRSQS